MPGPLLTGGLIAGGNALMNFFGGQSEAKRMEELRRQLMQLFSSQSLGGEANELFSMFQKSPMYSGLRSRAMEGSTQLGNALSASYARSGMSNTGLAASGVPLARAGHLNAFQGIDSELFSQALRQAMGLIQGRAGALTGTVSPKGWEIGLGNTLQSLQPLLLKYFESSLRR